MAITWWLQFSKVWETHLPADQAPISTPPRASGVSGNSGVVFRPQPNLRCVVWVQWKKRAWPV